MDQQERLSPQQALDELRATHIPTRCPACGGTDWDDGTIVAMPISTPGQVFDWNRPLRGNDVYFAAALACRRCQYVLLLRIGRYPAQTE